MRSRAERAVRIAVVLLLSPCERCGRVSAAVRRERRADAPTDAEIAQRHRDGQGRSESRAGAHASRRCSWNGSERRDRRETPAWLLWIAGLFRWLGQSTRVLIWVARRRRWPRLAGRLPQSPRARTQRTDAARGRFVAPTHVRDLDIRPESLPADIGARRARAVGSRRASRSAGAAVSRHAVATGARAPRARSAIRAPKAIASRSPGATSRRAPARTTHPPGPRLAAAVYGGVRTLEAATVHVLCDDFAQPRSIAGAAPRRRPRGRRAA